jgi:hypothetical protein
MAGRGSLRTEVGIDFRYGITDNSGVKWAAVFLLGLCSASFGARRDPCAEFVLHAQKMKAAETFPWTTPTPLFYGCSNSETGHCVFGTGPALRWFRGQDANLPPQDTSRNLQGAANLYHLPAGTNDLVGGYTILAFWDRSVDSRNGSHSTYLLPGTLSFPEALEAAQKAFPDIWRRYRFAVTHVATFDIP